jgi:imidazolonepropionase-like amidohydrolase
MRLLKQLRGVLVVAGCVGVSLAAGLIAGVAAQAQGASEGAKQAGVLVVTGARILPITGPAIEHGVLVVRDGKITAVGAVGTVDVPAGATVVDASGKTVMPGIVDSHSHIGIDGNPTVSDGQDGNEGSDPLEPALRALDAINPNDPDIRMATAGGITTANIMPGSGNVMGGQTAYVKLRGRTIEEMLIPGTIGGMKMANGTNPKGYGARGQAPMTRMEEAALARSQYEKGLQYKAKWDAYKKAAAKGDKTAKAPDVDMGLEAVVQVLDGKRVVHNHTHRADDVMTVLRLSDEFHYRVVVHHGTESCAVASELAKRHIGVSYTMIDSPGGKPETINFSISCPARLEKAGVKVAFNTDDPITNSRLLLRSAALAVRGGMSEDAALKGLTIYPAEMLDLKDRVGSLEAGKDADFVVLSGPPLSVWTHVEQTWIEGQKVFDRGDAKQRRYATGGFNVGDRYPEMQAAQTAGGAQ